MLGNVNAVHSDSPPVMTEHLSNSRVSTLNMCQKLTYQYLGCNVCSYQAIIVTEQESEKGVSDDYYVSQLTRRIFTQIKQLILFNNKTFNGTTNPQKTLYDFQLTTKNRKGSPLQTLPGLRGCFILNSSRCLYFHPKHFVSETTCPTC